jgi:hypothetical protein
MPPAALLTLRHLALAEPLVTIGALLAWIRAGRRNHGISTMRDYLAARSVNTTVNISLFYLHGVYVRVPWLLAVYLDEYWVGFFVVAWFMLRVLGDTLQRSLRSTRGLQALAKTAFRWVLVAAMLLALPAGVALAIVWVSPSPNIEVLHRFFAAISIAQLFPIGIVMILGLRAGCNPGRRYSRILAAFCLEPAWVLITTWFRGPWGVLIWTNLVLEVVCYAALGLWTWYAFHPDREDQLPTPNPTLQHWDLLARKALRQHLPPIEETEPVAEGARPRPRPND